MRNKTARLESIHEDRQQHMTVRDNPVRRIIVVRKIGGKLVIDVQGTVRVPIKLKLNSVPAPKIRIPTVARSKWTPFTRHPYRDALVASFTARGCVQRLPNRSADAS